MPMEGKLGDTSMPLQTSASVKAADAGGFLISGAAALASGGFQAVLFNPVDRALYVRVKFRRERFLDRRNFQHPFQGFMNAGVYRTLVGASYMFWQDLAQSLIRVVLPLSLLSESSPGLHSILTGMVAGFMNGLALNSLQSIKFTMWNSSDRGATFWGTASRMYRQGGIPIFFRGCVTTVVRDTVFGVVYETTRHMWAWKSFFDRTVLAVETRVRGKRKDNDTVVDEDGDTINGIAGRDADVQEALDAPLSASSVEASPSRSLLPTVGVGRAGSSDLSCGTSNFMSNMFAAIAASIMSSPFNYVRSIVYGTPAAAIPLSYTALLRSFCTQVLFTYRNGMSYTAHLTVPELSVAEYGIAPTSHAHEGASAGHREGTKGKGTRHSRLRAWSNAHRCHPIAAWRWANSRLNIGWGSLRVGLGMAIGQSLFHFVQDRIR